MKSFRFLLTRIRVFVLLLIILCAALLFVIFISATARPELFTAFLLGGGLLILIIAGLYQFVHKPYKGTSRLLKLFAQGYTMERVYDMPNPISPEITDAFNRFKELVNTTELINLSVKQSQYLALQNQINPHFLYNTLEGIRGEALSAGVTSIAQMTEALSTFFRYTISNVDRLVTLEEELENIENYCIIQQYRFGDRLSLSVEVDDEDTDWILNCRMPKLTLQPIVENSIYHGLEPKLGKGNLKIKVESTKSRLIITVSDDGLGFEEERLSILNNALNGISVDYVKPDSEKKGGIALINVNSRIKLLFGEEYGLYIYSSPGAGTDVQITLPILTENVNIN
ncbi:MAG: histidine kinase [Clostridiaceae bacterium]|nr:histidine kinase [Clostridiaceae bacterium]